MQTNHLTELHRFVAGACGVLLVPFLLNSCIMKNLEEKNAQVVYNATATIGEGSIWHPERKSLFWVDIEGKTLFEYLPDSSKCRSWIFDRMVSTVVPESDSTVVVSLQNEIVRINVNTGEQEHVAPVDDQDGALRCNDGKCDSQGRFWIGTMCMSAPAETAQLFLLDDSCRMVSKIEKVTISNGLVWSADNQWMYYIDTPTKKIVRYRYDAVTGNIVYDGVAVTIPENCGSPDGMTIDENGNLWVAHWGGFGVYCWNPHTGELLNRIQVEAPHVASCAFGGDNLDTLYITTARAGLSKEDLEKFPESGSLFVYKPGVKGVKTNFIKL